MNTSFTTHALLFISIVMVLSCANKTYLQKPYATEENEITSLLTNKYWLETNVIVDTIQEDITPQFPLPDRDDVIYFSDNGTYRFEEGGSKHNESNKDIFLEGTWRYEKNTKTLELKADDSITKYKLLKISEADLLLSLSIDNNEKLYSYHLKYRVK